MKRYNEIVCLVRSDAKYEQNVEIERKDLYCNKEENQDIVRLVILSAIHEKLGNTYTPYNDFESPYITNKKELTITNTNDGKIHITPEKETIFDEILSKINLLHTTELSTLPRFKW